MLAMLGGAGDFEGESEDAPGLQRIDESIHVAARGGVAGTHPALVVGARFFDALFEVLGHGLAFGFELFKFGTVYGLDGGIPFHDSDASSRPSEGEVGIKSLTRHGVISGAAR